MAFPINPTPVNPYDGDLPDPSDPSSYGQRGRAFWAWETGTLLPGMNELADNAYDNAVSAADSATAAYLNANYKGAWSSLTGALTVPALVSHAGERWNLLSDLADVTASEPGVDPEWELFQLPPASGVGYDPSGTNLTATQVQAAIDELSGLADAGLRTFRNRVVNGAMRSAQMLHPTGGPGIAPLVTSFPVLANTTAHTLDLWKGTVNGTGTMTITRATLATDDDPNAQWLVATVGTADVSMDTGNFTLLSQGIEGYDIGDLVGNDFTMSFWVKSSVTGAHSVSLRNTAGDRSYIHVFNIAVANTPQKVVFTVVGGIPASGTWDFTTGSGLRLAFCMASGSTYVESSLDSWVASNRLAGTGQVNFMATSGNVFAITEVQIERGAVATPFERIPLAVELARVRRQVELCRYVMMDESLNGGNGSLGHAGYYKQTKRATPTITALAPNLVGGDSLTLPSFSGNTELFYQTSAGVWNPFAGGTAPLAIYMFSDASL